MESKEKKRKNKEYQIELWLERRLENTIRYALHLDKVRSAPSSAEQGSNSFHPHFSAFRRNKVRGPRLFVCVLADIQSSQTRTVLVQLFQLFFFSASRHPIKFRPSRLSKNKKKQNITPLEPRIICETFFNWLRFFALTLYFCFPQPVQRSSATMIVCVQRVAPRLVPGFCWAFDCGYWAVYRVALVLTRGREGTCGLTRILKGKEKVRDP